MLIAHSNKHRVHIDWGVVAGAHQEVWFGNGVGVARGGLLAGLCGVFLFCFWMGQTFRFLSCCWYMYVQVRGRSTFQRMVRFLHAFLFFPVRRSKEKVSRDHLVLLPLPPAAYLEGSKSPKGLLISSQSGETLFAYCTSYLGPTETVSQSQLG